MSNPAIERTFRLGDLERWAELGLIEPDQVQAIRTHLTNVGGTATLAQPPRARPGIALARESGLNLVTVAYYFGAFMILFAYTFFVGLQWEAIGPIGRVVIAAGTVALLVALGRYLHRIGVTLAGNLLVFAGTGVVPLVVYTVLQLAGLWPDGDTVNAYADFYVFIDGYWIVLEIVSIAAAVAVAVWTRFPLMTLLIGFWTWFLSMDLAEAVTGRPDFDWSTPEFLIGTLVGVVSLAIGVWCQRRAGGKDWAFWLYLFGHIAVLGNLGALALNDANVWFGLLFLAVYLAVVVASVWLQSRVFLVFGALGIYSYACKLAFDVFDGSVGFMFALAMLGLLVILSAVWYQRTVDPWLRARLARRTA